jgi:hypothetical protein
VFEIDDREILPETFVASIAVDDAVIYEDEGLVIRVAPFAYSYSVQIRDHIELVVTASSHEHPTCNHVDIGISKLNVTGRFALVLVVFWSRVSCLAFLAPLILPCFSPGIKQRRRVQSRLLRNVLPNVCKYS